jgi:hypothetical protein
VQLRPGIADAPGQLRLDIHVYVFQFHLPLELPRLDLLRDPVQSGYDLLAFFRRNQPRLLQSRRMGDRPGDVMPPKPPIEADGFAVLLKQRGGFLLKAAFPHGDDD